MTSRIVIIGGGFSGTALAARLLRKAPAGLGLQVTLINRFGPIGPGVAYGTKFEGHLLNVPAEQMSIDADEPDHFLEWGRAHGIERGNFVPRKLYGAYVKDALESAARSSSGASLEQKIGVVKSVRPDGDGAAIVFQDGAHLRVDRVALALGNYSPEHPRAVEGNFVSSPRYVRDPWIPGSLDSIEAEDSVLLLGTGLTTIDIALDLASRDVRPPIVAMSRRGLVPHSHVQLPARPAAPPPPDLTASGRLREYVALLRRHARTLASEGRDWRDAVGSIRSTTPVLWHALPIAERERFLRHVRVYWDVHRHRAAPASAKAFTDLRSSGRIIVRAGRLLRMEDRGGSIAAAFRPRHSRESKTLTVNRVINCTGPSSDVRTITDPLIVDLKDRGLLRPDPLGLGIDVSDDLALIDHSGKPSEHLFLIGPLLKARYWEATAVPELRMHAAKLAETVVRSLRTGAKEK